MDSCPTHARSRRPSACLRALPRLVDRGSSFRKRWPSPPPPFEESPGTRPRRILSLWRAVVPRRAFLDCKRLWRVTRRGSRSNGGEFALEGGAGAAVSVGNGFGGGVSLIRETLGRARSEERGGCVAPPNATNFCEEVEPVVLDSLSTIAPAPGVGAARTTPSSARRTRSKSYGTEYANPK